MKGTTAKVANLPQFLQSSHSPTAMLRIVRKNAQILESFRIKQAQCLESFSYKTSFYPRIHFFTQLRHCEPH
ncbi:hypothetical protein [Helicobacter canis]|uniref:Uncharacterized protein n=1 Tax=Helicobacter canis TaxID=29419 RepID=A0A5M9QEK4_9HELI|nr:hypothetical protein [Helicobacter canis]KAA8707263.1 hypothetical protein F4V45_09040 [Helicobacter canis]